MGKHVLDESVEDILQHYGIKGMKWGKKQAEGQAESDTSSGGGGGYDEEEEDDAELRKKDAIKKKAESLKKQGKLQGILKSFNLNLGKANKASKDKGKALMKKLLGEGKPTYTIAKPNAKLTKNLRESMKKSNRKVDPDIQKVRDKAEANYKKYNSNSKVDSIVASYKKQGYKKHESKDKRTLAEKGYTFKTGAAGEKLLAQRKKEGYKKNGK